MTRLENLAWIDWGRKGRLSFCNRLKYYTNGYELFSDLSVVLLALSVFYWLAFRDRLRFIYSLNGSLTSFEVTTEVLHLYSRLPVVVA
jgi:hypothetical protein